MWALVKSRKEASEHLSIRESVLSKVRVSGLKRLVGVWTIVAEYRYSQGDARHDRLANHRLRKATAFPAGSFSTRDFIECRIVRFRDTWKRLILGRFLESLLLVPRAFA